MNCPKLPQQEEGTRHVVKLLKRGPAESQSLNPLNTKFATGVDPGPSRGHSKSPPVLFAIYKAPMASVSVVTRSRQPLQ